MFEFFEMVLVLVMPLGSCRLSAVPGRSYHPEAALLCRRIHTSIKLRLKWPEPTIQEVLLILLPRVGLRRRHLGLPK